MVVGIMSDSVGLVIFKRYQKNEKPIFRKGESPVIIHLFWLSEPKNNPLHPRPTLRMRPGKRLDARYQARRLTPSFEASIDEYRRAGTWGDADQNHSNDPPGVFAGFQYVSNTGSGIRSHTTRLVKIERTVP